MKIASGVPLPRDPRGRPPVYPFAQMQPGDSLFAPGRDGKRLQLAAHAYARLHGVKVITRTEGNGIRVWRVE